MSTQRLIAAHQAARAFYHRQLRSAPGPRRYLTIRGFQTLAAVREPWHLGYAPAGRTNLVDHLRDAGYTRGELLRAGLAIVGRADGLVDLFRDRVMFPIHDPHGRPIGFLGRALPSARIGVPKYLNTPDTAIYHKGQTLYGLGEQRHLVMSGAIPVLVEGPADVLAIHLAHPDGDRVGLATCGTTLTRRQADSIASLPGSHAGVAIAYDNDPPGHIATLRAFDLLPVDLPPRAATLPDGADPGSLATTGADLDRLRAAIGEHARPLAQAVIDIEIAATLAHRPDALTYPEGRVALVRRLAARIARLPAPQVVDLAGYIATRTGAQPDTVSHAIIDVLEDGGLGGLGGLGDK